MALNELETIVEIWRKFSVWATMSWAEENFVGLYSSDDTQKILHPPYFSRHGRCQAPIPAPSVWSVETITAVDSFIMWLQSMLCQKLEKLPGASSLTTLGGIVLWRYIHKSQRMNLTILTADQPKKRDVTQLQPLEHSHYIIHVAFHRFLNSISPNGLNCCIEQFIKVFSLTCAQYWMIKSPLISLSVAK